MNGPMFTYERLVGCVLVAVRATARADLGCLKLKDGGTEEVSLAVLKQYAQNAPRGGRRPAQWRTALGHHISAIVTEVEQRLLAPECVAVRKAREKAAAKRRLASMAKALRTRIGEAQRAGVERADVVRMIDAASMFDEAVCAEVLSS